MFLNVELELNKKLLKNFKFENDYSLIIENIELLEESFNDQYKELILTESEHEIIKQKIEEYKEEVEQNAEKLKKNRDTNKILSYITLGTYIVGVAFAIVPTLVTAVLGLILMLTALLFSIIVYVNYNKALKVVEKLRDVKVKLNSIKRKSNNTDINNKIDDVNDKIEATIKKFEDEYKA